MKKFEDKVAVVTGAGQGIGEQIALTLGSQGAALVLADIDEAGMVNVQGRLEAQGCPVITVKTDVTIKADVEKLFEKAVKAFGTVDILVNNAGTIRPSFFPGITEEDWDFLQAVDLKGVLFCTQTAAPIMKEQGSGKIVNISSMSAFGIYMPGFASYSAAKAGVNSFTQYTARELGPYGVNVNAVAPGEIMTPLTYKDQTAEEVEVKLERSTNMAMIRRLGQPEDVANAVSFLASEESSFITGVVLNVDGGRIDRM